MNVELAQTVQYPGIFILLSLAGLNQQYAGIYFPEGEG
jgi:hypothetical protein